MSHLHKFDFKGTEAARREVVCAWRWSDPEYAHVVKPSEELFRVTITRRSRITGKIEEYDMLYCEKDFLALKKAHEDYQKMRESQGELSI